MKKSGDKVSEAFAKLMIQKIEEMTLDWHKPWVSGEFIGMPQNFSGRPYNGMNSLMLMLHCEKEGYSLPVFMTFHQAKKEGWNVRRGEIGFPVQFYHMNYIGPDKNKLTQEEYQQLSEAEKKECRVYPSLSTYIVFNVDQTNMRELAPEKYDSLRTKVGGGVQLFKDEEGRMLSPELEHMLQNQTWLCPIEMKLQDKAYYTTTADKIVMPLKEQFPKNEQFYSTLLHEVAHSTGHELRLNRDMEGGFGSYNYGREELVAEMTSALACAYIGIDKGINPDNVAYLQGWLKQIKEKPEFIMQVMGDVNKASTMIMNQVFNPEMAEELKNQAIESISRKLEEKSNEEKVVRMSTEQVNAMTPSIGEVHERTIEINVLDIDPLLLQTQNNRKTEVGPENIIFIMDAQTATYYVIGEDARMLAEKTTLPLIAGKYPDGVQTPVAAFTDEKFQDIVSLAIRGGLKVSCTPKERELQPVVDLEVEKILLPQEELAEYAAEIKNFAIKNGANPDTVFFINDNQTGKVMTFDKDAETVARLTHTEILMVQDRNSYIHPFVMVDREQVNEIIPLLTRQGRDVQLLDNTVAMDMLEQARINREQPNLPEAPKLHIAHLGNGLTAWEEGDNDYTAFISPERKLSMDKEFNPVNQKMLEGLARHGNRIIGNSDSPHLALQPNSLATRLLPMPYGQEGLPVSLETIKGEQWVCNGYEVIYKDGDQGKYFKDLPEIKRPETYILSISGIDNIRRGLELLTKQGVYDGFLKENFFYVALEAAEKDLKDYEREDKRLFFKIQRNSEKGLAPYQITGFSHNVNKLDVDNTLPRYYMRNNVIRYNKPGLGQPQSIDQMLLGSDVIVKVCNANNFKRSLNALDKKGVMIPDNIVKEMTAIYRSHNMTSAEREASNMYLYISNGYVTDSEPNINEEEYKTAILTYNGKIFEQLLIQKDNTNQLNNTTMAKKEQVQEQPEVQKEQTGEQQVNNQSEKKKGWEDGYYFMPNRDKDKKEIPGLYHVFFVKDGVLSEMATVSKEDRDQYFNEVKGKKGEEAAAVRKALVDKYIGEDGKRLNNSKEQVAEQPQEQSKDNMFIIRHTSQEKADRITDARFWKNNEKPNLYHLRCKIDGRQVSMQTFDRNDDFGKKVINAFYAKFDTLSMEDKARRTVDLAAAMYNKILNAPAQEVSQGLKR